MLPIVTERPDFEIFKSDICHRVKDYGDKKFILAVLTGNAVETYFERGWYPESLYLLAMVDYISRVNDVPYCSKYNLFRPYKLDRVLYPRDILLLSEVDKSIKQKAWDECIPEFKRHNIVENEVRRIA